MKVGRLLPTIALLVVGMSLILAFFNLKPFGMLHDDACYVRNALAWLGLLPPPDYRAHSVGASLAILPYLALFPESPAGSRNLFVVFSLAWVLLYYRCLLRMVDPRTAWLLALCIFLSPGFLLNASHVMGEPLLGILIWLSVSLASRSSNRATQGALLACGVSACFTRSEGVVLPLVIILWYLFERQFRNALHYIFGLITSIGLINAVLIERGPKYHQGQLLEYFHSLPQLSVYPQLWVHKFLSNIGLTFLAGLPQEAPFSGWSLIFTVFFVTLAIAGWFRLGQPGSEVFVKVLAPCLLAALFFWPYLQPRHLLALWPILILCAALALPWKHRWKGVFALALYLGFVALPNLVRGQTLRHDINQDFLQTVRVLDEQSAKDTVIMTNMGCSYSVLTLKSTVDIPSTGSLPTLLLALESSGASYLVWEKNDATLTDVQGIPQVTNSATLSRWIGHASYFKTILSNSFATIYQFQPPYGFQQSYAEYSQAIDLIHNNQTTQGQKLLESALDRTPDLPFAASALVEIHLESRQFKQARDLLEKLVHQYPFDLTSLYNLALVTAQLGEHERALGFATFGRQIAQDTGDQAMIQMFEALLSGSGDSIAK